MLLRCPSCSARYEVAAGSWPADGSGDGSLLLRPRKVRCRRCQEVWLATPEADEDIFDPGPPLAESLQSPVKGPVPAAPGLVPLAHRSRTDALAEQPAEAEPEAGRSRRWPWLVAAFAVVLGGYAAVATGRVAPEDYGLPPLAPWAKLDPASIAWPDWQLPALSVPAVAVPDLDIPAVALPQAPAPKLTLQTDATTRPIPGGGTVWNVTGAITNPTRSALPIPPISLELLGSKGDVLAGWSIRPPAESLAPGATVRFDTSTLNPPAAATRLRVTLKPASLARL